MQGRVWGVRKTRKCQQTIVQEFEKLGTWDDKFQDLYLDFCKELCPNTWVTSKLITILLQARGAESCRSKLNLLLFSTTSASIVHLEPRFPEAQQALVYFRS
jgi:hypothetical protein